MLVNFALIFTVVCLATSTGASSAAFPARRKSRCGLACVLKILRQVMCAPIGDRCRTASCRFGRKRVDAREESRRAGCIAAPTVCLDGNMKRQLKYALRPTNARLGPAAQSEIAREWTEQLRASVVAKQLP